VKTKLFYLLIVIIASLSLWSLAGNRINDGSNGKKLRTNQEAVILSVNNSKIQTEIADTPAKRELGLSGRPRLLENEGLLFIFDQPDQYKFWMKDMNFPIDIIWLDENKKIVDITTNLATSTYPNSFTSLSPAKYVLELNAGFTAKNNIKVGNQASW